MSDNLMNRALLVSLGVHNARSQLIKLQNFSTTAYLLKKKQHDTKRKGPAPSAFANIEENAVLKDTVKEVKRIEEILNEELNRHFSLKVDIRQYEDVMVKLDTGKEKQLSHIARVTLKSPLMVMINFQDNPSAIKAAKLAIQKSTLNVTPQQEGAVLYVNVPPMSRERREQMAADAKGRILNEYKKALNEIYSKSDKKSSQEFASHPDDARKTRQALLDLKHSAEKRGTEIIEQRRQQLLKQVI